MKQVEYTRDTAVETPKSLEPHDLRERIQMTKI